MKTFLLATLFAAVAVALVALDRAFPEPDAEELQAYYDEALAHDIATEHDLEAARRDTLPPTMP